MRRSFFFPSLGALFLALLLLLFSPMFSGSSNAVSAYDSYYRTTSVLEIFRTTSGCSAVDYAPDDLWYTDAMATTALSPAVKTDLNTALTTGGVVVSQIRTGSATTRTYKIVYDTVGLTYNWTAFANILSTGVGNFIEVEFNVLCQTDYTPVTGNTSTYISSVADGGGSGNAKVYKNYGNVNYNLPVGYAGTMPVSETFVFPPPPTPDVTFNTLVSETMDIVKDEADTAVKLGLILGSINFIFQWLFTILMGRKYDL